MISVRSIASVYRFEMRRAATIPRMAWWVALAVFPVVLSLLVKHMIDENPPPSNARPVVRIDATEITSGGAPTIQVDGRTLSGTQALAYIQEIGRRDFEQRLREQLQRWGWDPEVINQPGGPQLSPGMLPPKPVLIIKHPADVSPDDKRLNLLKISLEKAFDEVIFHAEGDPDPNVQPPSPEVLVWASGLFILLPTVVSMLGVFLWATPSIAAELERRSWIYLATRPYAAVSVMLGKYLVGITWGISAALTGTALCVWIADLPEGFMYLFKPLALLILLGCPAYGAVYTLIGAIMPRRAMVIAVVYSLVFEGAISLVPALINKVTVQFHLRAMWVRWLGIERLPGSSAVLSTLGLNETTTLTDLLTLFAITAGALTAAVWVLRWQELSAADESDS